MSDTLDTWTIRNVLGDMEGTLNRARDVLAVIGTLYVGKVVLNMFCGFVNACRVYIIPRFWHNKDFPKRFGGKWAIITGASEGIGRAYAFKLAERNMNLFLISRNSVKLMSVAHDIRQLYPHLDVQVRCYPLDCTTLTDPTVFGKLQKELDVLDVGVLVNNVGQMYEKLQYFLTVDTQRLKSIIDLNIQATVLMTKLVLPQMVSRQNGAIVNIGSLSCLQPSPLMTVYSASKSFTNDFTTSLEYEYASKGITMQVINPSYISTNMTYYTKPSLLVPDPFTFVDSAIRTLGVSRQTNGYWTHGILASIMGCLPLSLHLFGSLHINNRHWSQMTGVPL